MIFSPDLAAKVLDGTKTVTRRPVRAAAGCRYRVGSVYAVQAGRGKYGKGRVRILSARLEPLVGLTADEARREGFDSPEAFADRWESLYGRRPDALANPLSTPMVWRIEFELA